jgi:hypothetical protein
MTMLDTSTTATLVNVLTTCAAPNAGVLSTATTRSPRCQMSGVGGEGTGVVTEGPMQGW